MIIGIAGKKRSGKDTIADYLCGTFGFKKLSFSTALKEGVKHFFGWTEEHVNGKLKDECDHYWGISPRQVLQELGTEFFQFYLPKRIKAFQYNTNRQMWVKRLFKDFCSSDNIVISDIRFIHEIKAVKDRGGIVIKVEKPVKPILDKNILREEEDKHISELEVEKFDRYDKIFINDSTIESLLNQVNKWYKGEVLNGNY